MNFKAGKLLSHFSSVLLVTVCLCSKQPGVFQAPAVYLARMRYYQQLPAAFSTPVFSSPSPLAVTWGENYRLRAVKTYPTYL